MPERIWLDVPFEAKDDAKAAGARWDPAAKRWYAPRSGMSALAPWAALSELPELLPGEDRSFGSGLFVDPLELLVHQRPQQPSINGNGTASDG